jgi:phosphoribosylformylglycinamidine cyclo-ligase
MTEAGRTYESSGVAALDGRAGFRALLAQLKQTFALRPGTGRSLLDFGAYASILEIGGPQALAISTDGVGTKCIVAQLMDRYDTVGIDCVAMNVNDILCVGAEPIAMTDYIAVEVAGDRLLEEIGKGLLEGARQANISIPGGEISQIPEIIRSERPGYGFDLLGTAVGLVDKDAVVVGEGVTPGQAIVGLASSGIHSNGLTLARKVLLRKADSGQQTADSLRMALDARPPELGGRTVGEELLEPTRIYVKAVMPALRERLATALCHVTSDGFLNLARLNAPVGFEIERLPETPAIFELIQRAGNVAPEEMFRVYNMGVGFCVVCAPDAVSRVIAHAAAAGVDAWEIGCVVDDPRKRVWLRQHGLVGEEGRFVREASG